MRRRPDPLPRVQQDYIPFNGGLDLVSGSWNAKPGTLRQSQNYEIDINGGYQDILGYERFNGLPSPSDAGYFTLPATMTEPFAAGDIVTGDTSEATARIIGSNDIGLFIADVIGTFSASEDLVIDSVVAGQSSAVAFPGGGETSDRDAFLQSLAADAVRANISPVPGAGPVTGVFQLGGRVFAWRNDVGGAAASLYGSSPTGWTQIGFDREIAFTSGSHEILPGDIIVGATSGATAEVVAVSLVGNGSWTDGDAAGYLVVSDQTGTFEAENLDIGSEMDVASIDGDSSAIAMLPNGRFEVVRYNFGTGEKAYGVDAVNRAWEFDGASFIPINTGMEQDSPEHIAAHRNHLFLSFGPSVQHSAIGDPLSFAVLLGAGELNVGADVTGFMPESGSEGSSAMGIYCRHSASILYGTSSADWNLVPYRSEIGAYAGTIQQMALTMFLDDRGITNLKASDVFGNFSTATFTKLIQPLINERRATAISSCIVRDKNQYRLFFNDGSALYVTMDGSKVMGIMPQQLGHAVRCVDSKEAQDGTELIFFGSDDGHVYQMERGGSFDGESIEAFIVFHFHYSKMLRWIKKYLNCTLEASGSGFARFNFSFELGHGDTDIPQPDGKEIDLPFKSVVWDSFVWDDFTWDSQTMAPTSARLSGSAENISLIIRKNSSYYRPVRFIAALITFLPRRMLRT